MDAAKSQHRLIVLGIFAYDGIEVFPPEKVLILADWCCPRWGKCLFWRIDAVPAGESAYPDGLVLSPLGKVLILPDWCCPRWGKCLSWRIGAVDWIDSSKMGIFIFEGIPLTSARHGHGG